MVLAIAVTLCAAALVLYYQHRALTTLESQTEIILKQVAEQAASDIAVEARRTLDGPLFETLTAVNHPELRAGRLDLVAREFVEGLNAYPHVDRFFLWTEDIDRLAPGEAVFVDRHRREGQLLPETVTLRSMQPALEFTRDRAVGRAIMDVARRYAPEQHIYVAAQDVGPGRRQALLRLFWTDARRESYFAVLGFLVDPETSGPRLFDALGERSLTQLLARRGGDTPLGLRVLDENGNVVYGELAPFAQAATATLPMLFYPVDRVESRLSGAVLSRPWRIEVSADTNSRVASVNQGYWPTVLSVLLMLVALGLTVLANRRLADLTKMQADFISHVSHQLKTPLSLLSAAIETVTMDRARSPEKLQQYLGIMGGEVARLSALVQRVLEYSRLQQQRGFEFEPTDLGALVRETVTAFENSLSARHYHFAVEEQSPPGRVLVDPAAIEQALVNLLDNAVKYSGEARQITVRLRGAGSSAIIEVIDQGIGIGKEEQRRIFDRFYRGAGGLVHRNGFGLGLPIVQELIHAHGGRVEVESQPGSGSTFRLVVPIMRERAGRAAADAPAPSGSGVLS
jgi:two-component system phosphate regulon sensor histidine kinase PhoR